MSSFTFLQFILPTRSSSRGDITRWRQRSLNSEPLKNKKKTQTRTQSFEHFEGKEPNDRGSAGTEEGADLTTNHSICAENSQNSLNESMAQEAHSISAAMTLVAL